MIYGFIPTSYKQHRFLLYHPQKLHPISFHPSKHIIGKTFFSHGNPNKTKEAGNLNITHALELLKRREGSYVIEYFNKITFLGEMAMMLLCQCESGMFPFRPPHSFFSGAIYFCEVKLFGYFTTCLYFLSSLISTATCFLLYSLESRYLSCVYSKIFSQHHNFPV